MKAWILVAAGLALPLVACGEANSLKPAPGQPLPVAPYGATVTPTPKQLLSATPQSRPQRSDEVLTDSERRRSDDFNLPPPN